MSYEIVKGLKIDKKNNKVFMKSCSNNVSPKYYEWQEVPYWSKMLVEKGLIELQKDILNSYYGGSLQGGNNNFEKSLKTFDRVKYSFENCEPVTKWGSGKGIYTQEELKNALYDNYIAFCNRKIEKGIFIITNDNCFISSVRRGGAGTCRFDSNAKRYTHKEKAEEVASRFNGFYVKKL